MTAPVPDGPAMRRCGRLRGGRSASSRPGAPPIRATKPRRGVPNAASRTRKYGQAQACAAGVRAPARKKPAGRALGPAASAGARS